MFDPHPIFTALADEVERGERDDPAIDLAPLFGGWWSRVTADLGGRMLLAAAGLLSLAGVVAVAAEIAGRVA